MTSVAFTNGMVVTRTQSFRGSVGLSGDRISHVDDMILSSPAAIDLEGDFLIPGIVDLHTDNVEKHFFPRPRVIWPVAVDAVFAHDMQMIGAGITTVFDALSLGDYNSGGARRAILGSAIEAISAAQRASLLRSEHFLHFRCEISDEALVSIVEPHLSNPRLKLMSIMDHTPGQRQWRDLTIFREYKRKKTGEMWSDEAFEVHISRLRRIRSEAGPAAKRLVCDAARQLGIPLASHDDTTCGDVDESLEDGVSICEFPTTLEAARRARALAMAVVMGGPNVVLGGSHSGNVSAATLVQEKLLDVLTSDYVPTSLLQGAFKLSRTAMSLADAIATVTAAPADHVGLSDRGRIEPGKKADLIRVRLIDEVPVVREVWRDGVQVVR